MILVIKMVLESKVENLNPLRLLVGFHGLVMHASFHFYRLNRPKPMISWHFNNSLIWVEQKTRYTKKKWLRKGQILHDFITHQFKEVFRHSTQEPPSSCSIVCMYRSTLNKVVTIYFGGSTDCSFGSFHEATTASPFKHNCACTVTLRTVSVRNVCAGCRPPSTVMLMGRSRIKTQVVETREPPFLFKKHEKSPFKRNSACAVTIRAVVLLSASRVFLFRLAFYF